jgi:hypothetical protein
MRRLPILQCPSVGDHLRFYSEPCTRGACSNWREGQCTAVTETEEAYSVVMDQYPDPGECPMASQCRWHVQAVENGQTKCLVRRLGELCEHQGGEWNTFAMAPAEEWIVEKS